MILKEKDIEQLENRYRANLINSITGIKPANLIGTRSKAGVDNLAIFSSVVHLGSNPAQIGMVTRPQTPQMKDTYSNILETGSYTINQISKPFVKQAHYTSARLNKEQSEFEIMNLKPEFLENHFAPFVSESQVKIGLRHLKSIDLPNGCIFIIGAIELIQFPEQMVDATGQLELEPYEAVGIAGLNSYYALKKIASFPYAKKEQVPNFQDSDNSN